MSSSSPVKATERDRSQVVFPLRSGRSRQWPYIACSIDQMEATLKLLEASVTSARADAEASQLLLPLEAPRSSRSPSGSRYAQPRHIQPTSVVPPPSVVPSDHSSHSSDAGDFHDLHGEMHIFSSNSP